MNVQELIKDNERLRDEVRRCYAELEEYKVKTEAYEDALYEDVLIEFKNYLKKTKGKRK